MENAGQIKPARSSRNAWFACRPTWCCGRRQRRRLTPADVDPRVRFEREFETALCRTKQRRNRQLAC